MEFFKGKLVVGLIIGLAIGLIIATGVFAFVARQDTIQLSRSAASDDEDQWLSRLKSLAFGNKEKECIGGAIVEYRGCKGAAKGDEGEIKNCRAILGGQVLECLGEKVEEEPSTINE